MHVYMHLLSIYSFIHYVYHKGKLLIATYICVYSFNSDNMPMKLVYWHYHPLSANELTGQQKLSKLFQGHTGITWRKQIVNLGHLASESAFNCNAVIQSILVIDKNSQNSYKKSTFRRNESFLKFLIHLNPFLCKYQIIIFFV